MTDIETIITLAKLANKAAKQYAATGALVVPSDDTRDFIEFAAHLLRRIWKAGYRYAKAGVMLGDFYDPSVYQPSLLDEPAEKQKGQELMSVFD